MSRRELLKHAGVLGAGVCGLAPSARERSEQPLQRQQPGSRDRAIQMSYQLHDLNAALTVVLAHMDMELSLESEDLPGDVYQHLKVARRGADEVVHAFLELRYLLGEEWIDAGWAHPDSRRLCPRATGAQAVKS